jgi:hypothetical protein
LLIKRPMVGPLSLQKRDLVEVTNDEGIAPICRAL